jgi:hypothetical protein
MVLVDDDFRKDLSKLTESPPPSQGDHGVAGFQIVDTANDNTETCMLQSEDFG